MTSSENKTCAICLGNVEAGQGQAIFTAECSHSFHFSCIGQNVTHGNHLCPVCRAKWNDLPFLMPNVNPNVNMFSQVPPPAPPSVGNEPLQFSDDEPLPDVTSDLNSNAGLPNVIIKAVPELQAIAASESLADFTVLVGLKAPPLTDDARIVQRAPIDLVTVLDVSGSMRGPKLALLKRAVSFVVDNLGPSDRLSIVCFSTLARRILPLRRMTDRGRVDAKQAVDSLLANGLTNIVDGLTKGVQVLEQRRQQNPVSSIIFLSDGRDTCNHISPRFPNLFDMWQPPEYLHLLPASIWPDDGETENQQTIPVHAFGFGSDHDPLAMHSISDSSGGTFSFIESYEIVQDAFASCIGGLLSIVIQELCITVRSASQGVDIKSIPSGRYNSSISEQGSHGTITVGDLYADEEKEFLIDISVPVRTTLLLDITCSYRDILSNETVHVEGDRVEIQRPGSISPPDTIVNLEVDRQRNRLNAAEGIAEAQRIAETGDLRGARAILSNRRTSLLASASGQAGDGLSMWLESEMKETEERMGSQEMYARSGRAYALSNMSAHGYQRATTRGSNAPASFDSFSFGGSSSDATHSSIDAYMTPSMANMVIKSQQLNRTEDGNPRGE